MNYHLTGNNVTLSHSTQLWSQTIHRDLSVRDILYNDHHELKVQIRSDEYFALLASTLDAIADKSRNTCKKDHPEIQALINDLLFLQGRYRIIKK